jgi:hypothetical protein
MRMGFDIDRALKNAAYAEKFGSAFYWKKLPELKAKQLGGKFIAIKVPSEPPRVLRRPFRLSHAAMAGCSSMA